MKLIVQIPCLNEADSLAAVIADIPRQIPGIDQVQVVVIDDGSSDGTADVAQAAGADHVVRLGGRRGLATAFRIGLDACLSLGADIIVNTDGDNQYPQREIPRLIQPLLDNQADMVIGDRQIRSIAHFSPAKKLLQVIGSWVVRIVARTSVADATSGFRAMSREMALRLVSFSSYSYTLETIIQAGKKGLRMAWVPIQANPPTRPSRLIRSTLGFVFRQAITVMRLYVFYAPLKTFLYLSLPFLLAGAAAMVRLAILYTFYRDEQSGLGRHLQSLIGGGTALLIGFLLLVLGILGELIGASRMQIEETLYRIKRLELAMGQAPAADDLLSPQPPPQSSEAAPARPGAAGPPAAAELIEHRR